MKRFFFLVVVCFVSIVGVSRAAPPYPLEVTTTETSMKVTLSGAAGQTAPLAILAQTEQSTGALDYVRNNGIVRFIDAYSAIPSPANRVRQVDVGGTATWEFATLPNTTYYIRVYNIANIQSPQLVTGTKIVTTPKITNFYGEPLKITTNGQQASFSGKLDTTKYGTMTGIRVELQYSLARFTDTNEALPQGAQFKVATQANSGSIEGVAGDGSYFFRLQGLTPNQLYFFRQVVRNRGVVTVVPGDSFRAGQTYTPSGSAAADKALSEREYRLLAPWPQLSVLMDPGLCAEEKARGTLDPNAVCDVNGFLNFAFKVLIGLTAVMLVLRLIYEGYQYIVTDVPFLKANAKSNFSSALIGLLIALSAYVILNTINPKLVTNTINIDQVAVGVKEFVLTGSLTGNFDGKPVKVNFNKNAYPAAKLASEKTGVDTAFILAIFAQETGSGTNLGACKWDAPRVMREDNQRKDKTAYLTIMQELGINPSTKSVSCPFGEGWGGAIGYTQFIPTTWLEQRAEAEQYLGHRPNPWVLNDALMVSAVYLKKLQGPNKNERDAACKYYSGSVCTPGRRPANEFYGNQVVGKKISIQKQIDEAKAKGEIR